MKYNNLHPGLIALAVTAFAIGIAEFIVIGILPDIATGLSIQITQAGNLVGYYALALAIGSPIVVLFLSSYQKKKVLLALIITFFIGSVISALSDSYYPFLAGRILTAIAHGSFFAIGATVAVKLVPSGQGGKAIAIMFSGLTLAMVLGVPFGSFIGNTLGWRFPLYAVSILAFIALFIAAFSLPSWSGEELKSIKQQLLALTKPSILGMMLTTILAFGASFVSFTYIIPLLVDAAGFTSHGASLLLMVFGTATLVGNMLGGGMTTSFGWVKTLIIQLILLSIILILIGMLLPYKIPIIILIFLWGVIAFGISPAVQQGMLLTAEKSAPNSIDFSSCLNISAFNLGIFFGGSIGGKFVSAGMLEFTPFGSSLVALSAFIPVLLLKRFFSIKRIAS